MPGFDEDRELLGKQIQELQAQDPALAEAKRLNEIASLQEAQRVAAAHSERVRREDEIASLKPEFEAANKAWAESLEAMQNDLDAVVRRYHSAYPAYRRARVLSAELERLGAGQRPLAVAPPRGDLWVLENHRVRLRLGEVYREVQHAKVTPTPIPPAAKPGPRKG